MRLLGERSQVPVVDAATVEVMDQFSKRRTQAGSVATHGQVGGAARSLDLDGLDDDPDGVPLRGKNLFMCPRGT